MDANEKQGAGALLPPALQPPKLEVWGCSAPTEHVGGIKCIKIHVSLRNIWKPRAVSSSHELPKPLGRQPRGPCPGGAFLGTRVPMAGAN